MSNRSRGRHRFDPPQQGGPVPSDDEQRHIDDVKTAFEQSNTKSGLRRLVGLILEDREKSLEPDKPEPVPDDAPHYTRGDVIREPTLFEKAILSGLAQKRGWNQARPVTMYQGDVEPWRIESRRARNRMARRSRRINRRVGAR